MYYSHKTCPSSMPWRKLCAYVDNLRRTNQPNKETWNWVKSSSLKEEIVRIKESQELILLREDWGAASINDRVIRIPRDYYYFTRDVSLAHELVHAIAGKEERKLLSDGDCSTPIQEQNNAIVDWLARKLRANKRVLYEIVTQFGLSPHIYDRISLETFKGYNGDKLIDDEMYPGIRLEPNRRLDMGPIERWQSEEL